MPFFFVSDGRLLPQPRIMAAHHTKRRWRVVAVLTVGLLMAIALFWRQGVERWLLGQTRQALANNNYAYALHSSTRLLTYSPESLEARRAAIRSAQMLQLYEPVFEHLRWLESHGELTGSDVALLGDLSFELGRAADAERYLKQALDVDPRLNAARSRLIHLLSIQCRTLEALAHRHELLRRRVWTTEGLMYMAKPDDLMKSPDLDVFLEADRNNPYLLLGKARHAKIRHQYPQALDFLDRALKVKPDLLDAHADRGMLLLEQPNPDEALTQWHADLSANADQHPGIWVVRGMWAKQRTSLRAAVRCFAEALRLDPNDRLATYQLSLALAALGEKDLSADLSARVTLIDELNRAIDDLYDSPESLIHFVRAGNLLEALGRTREAAAWYQTLADMATSEPQIRELAQQVSAGITRDTPMVLAASQPALQLDLDAYPLPSFAARESSSPRKQLAQASDIRFTEVASEMGIDFSFVGAEKRVHRSRRLYELFGAGIGVLDFDLDGWPDVYLAQGAPSLSGDGGEMRDELYWNRGGETFAEAAGQASLGDDRFSQGVAVGDFNNDGFPDLFVANVGANRLYQNNGDGTFQDMTAAAEIGGDAWTVSCAIADLNGDTLPDIYEVNYLGGKDAFTVLCDRIEETTILSCRPRDFPSQPDRFLLNLGDGRFADQTTQAGFVAPQGKGLGLAVADFNGDGRLSVFVANDTTSNHFYENRSPRGDSPVFEDQAAPMGLAFDRNGLTQACMGIAVDDANGDGGLDLFVTNFLEESNTLYLAVDQRYFEDASRASGLYAPSLALLGFGTQFLDADLDGDPDLVVTNGHITGQPPDGARFQMPGQFFENRAGSFVERHSREVGSYFGTPVLGRALTRLDLNRDGREDFAVSHLDAPLALLRNDSHDAGHYLTLRLVGVTCDRDAIGATVTVQTSADRKRVRQLTAGDGYQSSNQRQLVFGLGDATRVTTLRVQWPSGTMQEFNDLAVDRELILVEGRDIVQR